MGAEFSSSVLAFVLVIFEPVLVMLLFLKKENEKGFGIIMSYLCESICVDAYNYEEILIDSGYYTEDQVEG